MRYVITVNRAGLEDGTADRPIRVEDTQTGRVREYDTLTVPEGCVFLYRPDEPRQDGARLWVETETVA